MCIPYSCNVIFSPCADDGLHIWCIYWNKTFLNLNLNLLWHSPILYITESECRNHPYFTYLVRRLKFIAPHKLCLIEKGRSWHPFINLLKSKEAEINFLMLCTKYSTAVTKVNPVLHSQKTPQHISPSWVIVGSLLWVQLSAVITRSNIVRYYINNYRNWGRISIRCWIHKSRPIPRPNGRAMGVSFVNICEKIDRVITTPHCILENLKCYNSAALYLPFDLDLLLVSEPICAVGLGVAALAAAKHEDGSWMFSNYCLTAVGTCTYMRLGPITRVGNKEIRWRSVQWSSFATMGLWVTKISLVYALEGWIMDPEVGGSHRFKRSPQTAFCYIIFTPYWESICLAKKNMNKMHFLHQHEAYLNKLCGMNIHD